MLATVDAALSAPLSGALSGALPTASLGVCLAPPTGREAACALIDLIGPTRFKSRLSALRQSGNCGARSGRAHAQAHALEFAVERIARGSNRDLGDAETRIATLAGLLATLPAQLTDAGCTRFHEALTAGLTCAATLMPLFHLARTGQLHADRGFEVHFTGLNDATTYDLLISREGATAEVVCDVISAETGRDVHRGAWFNLADRIDPDLQAWLQTHPGRYLLKMTLPQGLRAGEDGTAHLAALHTRITTMLSTQRRADHDEAAVLRLDPLLLAGAQAGEAGLLNGLRREFGPEAHLAVTQAGNGLFVMAARAAREDEIAAAMRRRLAHLAPTRLTGTRPGILAIFIEDTDKLEWRRLRDQLSLEGETRQFLTTKQAESVVVVSCASRLELFGAPPPDSAEQGEMRFRNPRHPAAAVPGLAPSVMSAV